MKKVWFIGGVLTMVLFSVSAVEFFSSGNKLRIHEGAKRRQRLVFVPETPGAETGKWRISWENGDKIAELLLGSPIKLPPFEKKLRIEMELECPPGTTLLAADLRLNDSTGEVCVFNSNRANRNTGAITAVWEITPGQKVNASWGKNVNKQLDLPATVANFAFLLQSPRGDVAVSALRFLPDPQNNWKVSR